MKGLLDLLRDPAVEAIDVDADDRLTAHKLVLARKPMLRAVFAEFHQLFHRLDRRFLTTDGLRVELGAGVAPMRDSYPDVLATDIIPSPGLDRVLDAEKLDLDTGSVRVIFGQNCFHHFPHPTRFFDELGRVLPVGGGAILLEPYYGPVAEYMFRGLFTTEGFDKEFPSWETPASGPMNGANQALSYIVFKRDRVEFERRYPNLGIVHQETCGNYLRYLFSGGLNFRQIMPDCLMLLPQAVELLLCPINKYLALHHIVILKKTR